MKTRIFLFVAFALIGAGVGFAILHPASRLHHSFRARAMSQAAIEAAAEGGPR